jgi:hypothetical protein
MMGQYEAYVSIISNHCLCPAVTITRLKFGTTNNGDASSLYWVIWIILGLLCSIRNIPGYLALQTIRLYESGTGRAAHAFAS